jgi:SNF2 family DNA or RNA helicase
MTGMVPDVRRASAAQRLAAAEAIRTAALADPEHSDFPLPPLEYLNSAPCALHAELDPACLHCGIVPRGYQRAGAAWLFASGHGLLGDDMGTGKTIQCAVMFALMAASGELSESSRAVVTCPAVAVPQWAAQLRRLLPSLRVVTSAGGPADRVRAYLSPWEVAVVSDRVLVPQSGERKKRDGDVELLMQLPVSTLVYDDLDACRHETATRWAVSRLARRCTRVHALHGTPLQKQLEELWHFLEPVGGMQRLGTLSRFRQSFITQSATSYWVTEKTKDGGSQRVEKQRQRSSGVRPDALPMLRERLAPMILRRTAESLGGQLPEVIPARTWVELLPAQRARYDELRKGSMRRLTQDGEEVTRVQAMAAWNLGRQICSGLAAVDGHEGRDVSVKLDWAAAAVTRIAEAGEKAVVFIYFRENVRAFAARLHRLGVGHVIIWSEETNPRERAARLQAFSSDPGCPVLIGTTAIERSLNLQAARHLIAADTICNPARMSQLVGRVRRMGSAHSSVVFHHLLARGTQEEDYPGNLAREQGMINAVWEEGDDVFTAQSPREVLESIARVRDR